LRVVDQRDGMERDFKFGGIAARAFQFFVGKFRSFIEKSLPGHGRMSLYFASRRKRAASSGGVGLM
jgi:hypothetical protein